MGVELVVSHHHLGVAGVDHGTDDLKGLDLLGSTIDEIANKDGLAFLTGSRVPIGATSLLVPEILEAALRACRRSRGRLR